MNNSKIHCGFIAIIGRSNVGKSTLLNKLVGEKISITSKKVKTTRIPILGICTENEYQAIYIDTPGLYVSEKCFNKPLTRKGQVGFLNNVDLVIFVTESTHWALDDEIIVQNLHNLKISVILAINKIDNLHRKADLLPHLQFLSAKVEFLDIVPISAKTGVNINIIKSIVRKLLPEKKHFFLPEQITNCNHRFMASEIIREKLMRFLGDELPYLVSVDIEQFQCTKNCNYSIRALIFVSHVGQKKIIVGKRGSKLKAIGTKARKDMQEIFKTSVYLKLWVKVV